MNSLFVFLGIESWKPIITALLLPPVPFLLMILAGARLMLLRRGLSWLLILLSVAGVWLSACTGIGRFLERFVLQVPPALAMPRIAELKNEAKAKSPMAIVVLGGGLEPYAPEYGVSNLAHGSLERLRYGLWLSRETGVPVAFSGGVGWAGTQSASEAEVAGRIASQDFGRPLRWLEDKSRDTRENATHTVPLLKRSGVAHILLVTHGWHMPRSKAAFEAVAQAHGIKVEVAPMGLASHTDRAALDWLPSGQGYNRVRNALRETLGRLMGA